ncbi:MAG: c-type cytochrome [Chloroflexota bacterium]
MLKAGRVLIPNFQNRLLVAISAFVGMLLLVGWVAINEPARMEVFTQQYHGRSLEAGAELFMNNCSTCHGVDGKGTLGKAPALNNPMLFLNDNPAQVASQKVDDLKSAQASLQGEIDTYQQNVLTFAAITKQLKTVKPGSDDEKKLQTQLQSLTAQISNFDLAKTQEQVDAYISQINTAQGNLTAFTAKGWDPTRRVRLKEVGWAGTIDSYVASTVISGRPVSSLYWPQAMPAWGSQGGGPLRPDDIDNLVNYVLNFKDTAVQLTPNDVNQQFKLPGGGGGDVKVNASGQPVGTTADTKKLAADGKLTGGDAALGLAKYTSIGCAGCHVAGITGPITAGTYTRIVNERLKAPENAGKTPEEYIAESIIHPNAYIAPTFAAGVMPQDWGTKLDLKDIQDLIAYLETQK